MEITINGDKIDFTLEKEKTAGHIVDTLMDWAAGQNFFAEALYLNGKEIFLHQRDLWQDRDIKEITRLDLQIVSGENKMVENLQTLFHFFTLLKEALLQKDTKSLKELGKEYPYVKESLPGLLQLDPYILDTQLNSLINTSGVFSDSPDESGLNALLTELDNILAMLQGRSAELQQPMVEGYRTANTLIAMKEQLMQVPLLFQQGKDKEALDLIIVLSELLSRLFRILSTREEELTSSETFSSYMKEMMGILNELSEALKNEDTILMGDLIEYEILERLDFLPTLFEGGVKA